MTVRRFTTDRYGDRSEVSSHQLSGCALAAQRSSEDTARAGTVATEQLLYGPYGADLTAQDVVVLPDGTEWEVDGSPESWRSPFTGWEAGVQVRVRRVTG